MSAGNYNIQIMPGGIQTSYKDYIVSLITVYNSDRNIIWGQQSDNFILDLQVRDGSGTLVDGFKAQIFVKCPLSIECA